MGKPTHTLMEHVGKTVPELQARLAANPKLKRASSFTSEVEAESSVLAGIQQKQAELDAFLKVPYDTLKPSNNRLPLDVSFGSTGSVGTIVDKAGNVSKGTGIKIIIDKIPNKSGNPYTIVTAYPTP